VDLKTGEMAAAVKKHHTDHVAIDLAYGIADGVVS
jgi:hypothetical protein